MTSALSLFAQDKKEKGMDEMWGDQTKIDLPDIGDKAALFDDGNYSSAKSIGPNHLY